MALTKVEYSTNIMLPFFDGWSTIMAALLTAGAELLVTKCCRGPFAIRNYHRWTLNNCTSYVLTKTLNIVSFGLSL